MIGPLLLGGVLMLPALRLARAHSMGAAARLWPDAGLAGVLLMLATLLAPANRIAPTQYSQMLWAIGFGYWLFGNRWTGRCWSASR